MTASSQPPDLPRYLAGRGFAPSPGNPPWLELGTGEQAVRVRHEPDGTVLVYCTDPRGTGPRSACLYEAVFSPGTPGAVITAAIDAAISRPGPPGPGPGQEPAGRGPAKPGGDPR
jgi:hypothetical protein